MITRALKTALKRTFYQIFSMLGIYRIGRFFHRHQALILTYHGVLHNSPHVYMNRNFVEAAMFDRQMAFMARHYKVVPLSLLVNQLSAGKRLPTYTAVITFDDGFRNNFTVALPILKKYRLPATIFLATSFIGGNELGLWTEHVDSLIHRSQAEDIRIVLNGVEEVFPLHTEAQREAASDQIRAYLKGLPPEQRKFVVTRLAEQAGSRTDAFKGRKVATSEKSEVYEATSAEAERYAFLSWQEVKAMTRDQITFGSHSHTHATLAPLSEKEANFEVVESRKLIEKNLGACTLFSYPNGAKNDFGPREQMLLESLGFSAAVSQIDGFNDASTNLMALRRTNIVRDENFGFFLAKVSGVWSLVKRLQNRISMTTRYAARNTAVREPLSVTRTQG